MSEQKVSGDLKEHVKDSSVWMRLLFMLVFVLIYSAAEFVLVVVVFFQFLCVLFTGNKNEKVLSLGSQISAFIYQVLRYLTYNSETRPFPFADWPSNVELSKQAAEKKPVRKRAPAKKIAPTAKSKEDAQEKSADID